jgi:hypothetical protein
MPTYTLSGVTRDATGNPLPSVVVEVYDTASNAYLGTATSDGVGAYTATLSSSTSACFAVGYLVGSPDVAGTTLNNLVPVEIPDPGAGAGQSWYYLGF